MDLRIGHDRWGSSSNPVLNWKLHYLLPADIDKPLHDAAAEKIREYRADYKNRPFNSISFMPAVATTSGCLHCELVRIFFLQAHWETAFLQLQRVEVAKHHQDSISFRRAVFYSHLKSKVGNILAKATASRISLNTDGAPIASHT